MSRVKGGAVANKRRKKILEQVKGYRFGRSKKKRQAREAIYHAQTYAFAHRRDKKNDFRQLWITRINAVLKANGMQYSRFMKAMKDKGITLDRKILSTLAKDRPEAFGHLIDQMK